MAFYLAVTYIVFSTIFNRIVIMLVAHGAEAKFANQWAFSDIWHEELISRLCNCHVGHVSYPFLVPAVFSHVVQSDNKCIGMIEALGTVYCGIGDATISLVSAAFFVSSFNSFYIDCHSSSFIREINSSVSGL